MRNLIKILIAFLPLLSFGQNLPSGTTPDPSLKKEGGNSEIVEFANDHLGEKVGKGLCFELVRKACEQNDKNWYDEKWAHKSKYKVKVSDVKPGDVVTFHGCKFSNGNSLSYHIAIVYEVKENGVIVVAEQNSGPGEMKAVHYEGEKYQVLKESEVVLTEMDLSLLTKGTVAFYRF